MAVLWILMVALVLDYMILVKQMYKKISAKFFVFFEIVNPFFLGLFVYLFRWINRIKKRPAILVFTDSRGFEVTKFWNRKNPFSSYISNLIFDYSCTVKLCPEKFTSLLDFLDFFERVNSEDYDCIILHCGIVDFAPRPESSFDLMYFSKLHYSIKYPVFDIIDKARREPGPKYQTEFTYSFLTEEALTNIILPKLKKITNLLYIGISPVLNTWDGNYWRKRPKNINEQLKLDKLMKKEIGNFISLSELDESEIKRFTSDNVHYTKLGFDYIYKQLKTHLPKY